MLVAICVCAVRRVVVPAPPEAYYWQTPRQVCATASTAVVLSSKLAVTTVIVSIITSLMVFLSLRMVRVSKLDACALRNAVMFCAKKAALLSPSLFLLSLVALAELGRECAQQRQQRGQEH